MKIFSQAIMLAIVIASFIMVPALAKDNATCSENIGFYKASDLGPKTEMTNSHETGVDDSSKTASLTNHAKKAPIIVADADESVEGHGEEAGGEAPAGGFDRLWDVVRNG